MAALTRPLRAAPTAARPSLAAGVLLGGLALVAVGTAVPWLTLYAGLTPVPGLLLDGGPLAGLALAAAGLLMAASRYGGRLLRVVALLLALGIAADAGYSATRISGFVADPGPAAQLLQPASGPGALVLLIGAVMIAAAASVWPLRERRMTRLETAQLTVAALLLLAGWTHLLLVPEHLGESAALGVGFAAAGLAQVALAAVVLAAPIETALLGAVGVNAALLALYAWAVVIGLPIGAAGHGLHDAGQGLALFSGEPVDLAGAACAGAELLGIFGALALLGPRPDGAAGHLDRRAAQP